MSDKQGEFKTIVKWENLDIHAITEMWWDDAHNWSAQWMAINPSGGICKEEEEVGEPCILGNVLTVQSSMMVMKSLGVYG